MPLERRKWFLLLTLAVAFLATVGVFELNGIDLSLRHSLTFLLAWGGAGLGVEKLLALILIRVKPLLGIV